MKVLLAGNVPESLREHIQAIAPAAVLLSPADVEERPELLGEIEVVYGGLKPEQWEQATAVRWLQTQGAGVNGVLRPPLTGREVKVTTTSGIHAGPITEHMFGMLLMHTRRLGQAWDAQRERRWESRPLSQATGMLAGKTLGILGVGAIGSACARTGQTLGLRVIGMRRSAAPSPFVERMFGPEERAAFFHECDVLLNLLPLTPRTARFVGRAELAGLPSGAIVMNAGRGATMDTDALVAALRSGHLGGALLDVTDPEPLPPEHPLWAIEGVMITPHYSGAHPGYAERAGSIFLENLRRYVANEPMLNLVDTREGY